MQYLLLSCKNDVHEVHVLAGAVFSSFYHLPGKNAGCFFLCSTQKQNTFTVR